METENSVGLSVKRNPFVYCAANPEASAPGFDNVISLLTKRAGFSFRSGGLLS
jgi:hypothetical protein